MRHHFTYTEVPEDKEYVIETCVRCGAMVRRYKSGNMSYIDSSDKILDGKKNRPKCVEGEKSTRATIKDIVFRSSQPAQQRIQLVQQGLTQQEALLKDSLTIVRILYNDLVERRIYTQGRTIAANLLISQGYKEVVSHIESKLLQ